VSINQIPKAPDIAFVPTMGALHDGHLALIKKARELSETVVVSIFVNPLQFDNPDDLAKYPRDVAGDSAKALAAGATHIWAPTFDEVYPESAGEGAAIERLSAGHVGTLFEGASRPGHFDGMLTVVHRLFKAVAPKYAIFGEKDLQQLFMVRRWVQDSGFPVELIPAPIVREADGLAMSSRNVRLTPEGRAAATVISRALRSGDRARMHQILSSEPRFTLDYAELIDSDTFEIATESTHAPHAIVAGWIDGVRLIDNMQVQTTEAGAAE
jgi:pantoate--beta-alanine ligase